MTIILPIFQVIALAGLGYFLAGFFKLDLKTMTRLCLYVFNPALVFRSLYLMKIEYTDLFLLMVAYLLFMTTLLLTATLLSKFFNLENEYKSAFLLSTTIANIGTMGVPMVVFAFGEEAAGPAVFIFLMSTIYINTVGVYVATRGQNEHSASILTVFKMPSIYTGALGLLFNYFQIELPNLIVAPAYTLAGAAIPVLLLLLGAQISKVEQMSRIKMVIAGCTLKLVYAPVLAMTIAFFVLNLPVLIGKIFILLMAMPTAINASLLTAEFGADIEITAGITIVSTFTSVISLSICLWFISSGSVGLF